MKLPRLKNRASLFLFTLLAGLIWCGSYQVWPFSHEVDVGPVSDSSFVAGFERTESNGAFNYRRLRETGYVHLYQTGAPYQLTLRAATGQNTQETTRLRVVANGQELGQLEVTDTPQYFILNSAWPVWGPEDLSLTFVVVSGTKPKEAKPPARLALDWLRVEAYRTRLGLIIPPPFQVGWWLLVMVGWPLGLRHWLNHPSLPGWKAYLLPIANVVLVSGWLVVPATSSFVHSQWLMAGLLLALLNLALLVGGPALRWLAARRTGEENSGQSLRPVYLTSLLLLALACFYLASARGRLSYGDDHIMEAVSAAIVAGNPATPLTKFSSSEVITRYAKYGIGLSVVAVPFYIAGDKLAELVPFMFSQKTDTAGFAVYILLLTNLCLTVGAVYLFYRLLRLLTFGVGASLLTAALYALGTMAWHYARTFMSEPLVAFCLLAAMICALHYRKAVEAKIAAWHWAGLGGFMLGLAVATRLTNGLVLPFFALLMLWLSLDGPPTRQIRSLKKAVLPLLAWLLGVGFWLGVTGWYNFARFGSLTMTGYDSKQENFNTPFWTGFYGLVFSSGKSIFIYNPVLFIALLGWPLALLARRSRPLALVILGTVASFLVVYSMWDQWYGGGVWGPRFLVPIIPLLLWPAAYVVSFVLNSGRSCAAKTFSWVEGWSKRSKAAVYWVTLVFVSVLSLLSLLVQSLSVLVT